MSWFKRYGVYILVALLLSALVGFLVFLVLQPEVKGRANGTCTDYHTTKSKLYTWIEYYMDDREELPIVNVNATVRINESAYYIIDICALVEYFQNQDLSFQVPYSCIEIEGPNNDNCDGGNCSCYLDSHYIWAIDDNGAINSTCVGEECYANNEDGFQDVWTCYEEAHDLLSDSRGAIIGGCIGFAITLFLCVRFKRRPQSPAGPDDEGT